MKIRTFGLVPFALISTLAFGCALTPQDAAEEYDPEPIASVDQAITPLEAVMIAKVGSEALKNTVDSIDTIRSWFTDDEPPRDERIDHILAEMEKINVAMMEMNAKLDRIAYSLAVIEHKLDVAEYSRKRAQVQEIQSLARNALYYLGMWESSGRTDATKLTFARGQANLAIERFADGAGTDVFLFASDNPSDPEIFDYRLGLPYYAYVIGVFTTISAVHSAGAAMVPLEDQGVLKYHAANLRTIVAMGKDRFSAVADWNRSGNKYNVLYGADDALSHISPEMTDYCGTFFSGTLCWLKDPTNTSSWLPYYNDQGCDRVADLFELVAMQEMAKTVGIGQAEDIAKQMESLANFKRVIKIPRWW